MRNNEQPLHLTAPIVKMCAMNFVLVFIGGGIGASARYGLQGLVHRYAGAAFPYGTLVVNVLGCLAIGILLSLFEGRFVVNPSFRLFLAVGILGGFTTFSSFSYETMMLLREGSFGAGITNIAGTMVSCLAATWAGMMIGKYV
jgi:CrcB protein